MALKRRVFADLDRICPPHAILATNTSALDIDAIAARDRPAAGRDRAAFLQPGARDAARRGRSRHDERRNDVIATAMKLVKSLGKIGVLAGNCDGFIGNRMLAGYRREAEFLLLEGASPQQVDRALVGFRHADGPARDGRHGRARHRRRRPAPASRGGHAAGRSALRRDRGQAGRTRALRAEDRQRVLPIRARITGSTAGPGGRDPHRAGGDAARRRRAARSSDEEIVERCVYPLINEAARILEEGIAQRPGDIDVVWVNGYGFPRMRGGPCSSPTRPGLPVCSRDCSSSRASMARSTGRRLRLSSASWPKNATFATLN